MENRLENVENIIKKFNDFKESQTPKVSEALLKEIEDKKQEMEKEESILQAFKEELEGLDTRGLDHVQLHVTMGEYKRQIESAQKDVDKYKREYDAKVAEKDKIENPDKTWEDKQKDKADRMDARGTAKKELVSELKEIDLDLEEQETLFKAKMLEIKKFKLEYEEKEISYEARDDKGELTTFTKKVQVPINAEKRQELDKESEELRKNIEGLREAKSKCEEYLTQIDEEFAKEAEEINNILKKDAKENSKEPSSLGGEENKDKKEPTNNDKDKSKSEDKSKDTNPKSESTKSNKKTIDPNLNMNVEDFIKPNKSNTKQEVSTVKSDNQIKEEALAWKEYEEQQKQNEREVTPEEKEATERWLNGEEIEPQRNDETIVIEFSAKERKYKVINEDRDSKEDFEMTIDEIINSKEFSDFKEDILFNRDENLENMDTYLSFILNKSDNKWNTNKLENYINALNKKEAISAKTDIYYNMNGIYSKEYDEVSSNFFMDTANKHSNLGIADVEKNTWTKFLEKHDKIRKGIFNARKIANRVKNLVSKNKSLNGEPQKVIAESKYTDDQRALKEAREKREKYNEYLANKENNMQSEGKQVIHGSRAYRESIKASDEVINNIKKMQEEKKNNPKTKEELIAENKAKENEPLEGEGLSFEDWTK